MLFFFSLNLHSLIFLSTYQVAYFFVFWSIFPSYLFYSHICLYFYLFLSEKTSPPPFIVFICLRFHLVHLFCLILLTSLSISFFIFLAYLSIFPLYSSLIYFFFTFPSYLYIFSYFPDLYMYLFFLTLVSYYSLFSSLIYF